MQAPTALADSSATNTSPIVSLYDDAPDSEVTKPSDAQAASDQQYRAVLKAWREFDTPGAAPSASVIPSRRPIDAMRLSSSYGMRVHPISGRMRHHNGIDVPAPRGTPIYATADGIVGRAQWVNGYGKYVEVEHGGDIQTRYGHMSDFVVRPGQRVIKGDVIGYVGSTGRSTGNHLHYEVRIAGAPVNPLPFLEAGDVALAQLAVDASLGRGGPEQ